MLRGSGEDGRIVKRDVDNYQGNTTSFVGSESFVDEPVSQMRKVIAQRLGQKVNFLLLIFILSVTIDMENAMSARKSINSSIAPSKISFNDLVVKAVASSLKEHPQS